MTPNRPLLIPASIAALCAFALTGCADENTITKPDGYAEASRMCEDLGEGPDCDICEFYGWYSDGECDEFCSTSDLDCATDAMVDGAVLDTITVPDDAGVEYPDALGDAASSDATAPDGGVNTDAGLPDASATDGGSYDASLDASFDAGLADGGTYDGGVLIDTGIPDAPILDASVMDAGMSDGGMSDAGWDGSLVDGGLTDSGIYNDGGSDGSTRYDSGLSDAGPYDSGLEDGGFADSSVDGSFPYIDGGVGVDAGFEDFDAGGIGDAGGFDVGGGFPDVGLPDGSFGPTP